MRIRSRSIIIIISRTLRQATTIGLGVVLVRLVGKEVVGTYNQVFLVYMFLAGMLSLQIEHSLYYFIPKLGREERATLLAQTFLISLVTAALVGGMMFFGADLIARRFNNPGLAPLLRIFSLYPFVERFAILIPAFMISLDRPWRAGVYSLAEGLGRAAVVIGAVALGYNLSTVVWSMVTVGAVVVLVGCADMVRLSLPGRWRLKPRLVLELWRFSWPLWATMIVGVINVRFDKLLISSFFDPADFAVYYYGALELPVVATVTAGVGAAMMPDLVTLVDKGRQSDALNIWQEGARKCSLIIFPCFAFFLAVAPDLMVLLYGGGYRMAAWPFSIYLCALPIRVAIYATIFRAMGKTGPVAVTAVLALIINIVISTTLVLVGRKSFLSFIGPSIGTVCAQFAAAAFLIWQLGRIMDVPVRRVLRWKELGGTFLLSVVCGLIVFLIPLSGLAVPVRLAVRAGVFTAVLASAALLMRMIHDDEKELLMMPIRTIRRIIGRKKT